MSQLQKGVNKIFPVSPERTMVSHRHQAQLTKR